MMTGGEHTCRDGSQNVSEHPVLLLLCRDQLLLDQPDWDFDWFLATHLSDYLVMSQQFMNECFAEAKQQSNAGS